MSEMKPQRYRSVKVPAWVYENMLLAKGDLLVRGRGRGANLPRELRAPTRCPRCSAQLKLRRACFTKCPRCRFSIPTIDRRADLGVIAGLALSALYTHADPPRRLPTRKGRRESSG
jgi:hypothetical protein